MAHFHTNKFLKLLHKLFVLPITATTQVGSSGSGGGGGATKPLFSRPAIQQQSIEMLVSYTYMMM